MSLHSFQYIYCNRSHIDLKKSCHFEFTPKPRAACSMLCSIPSRTKLSEGLYTLCFNFLKQRKQREKAANGIKLHTLCPSTVLRHTLQYKPCSACVSYEIPFLKMDEFPFAVAWKLSKHLIPSNPQWLPAIEDIEFPNKKRT